MDKTKSGGTYTNTLHAGPAHIFPKASYQSKFEGEHDGENVWRPGHTYPARQDQTAVVLNVHVKISDHSERANFSYWRFKYLRTVFHLHLYLYSSRGRSGLRRPVYRGPYNIAAT